MARYKSKVKVRNPKTGKLQTKRVMIERGPKGMLTGKNYTSEANMLKSEKIQAQKSAELARIAQRGMTISNIANQIGSSVRAGISGTGAAEAAMIGGGATKTTTTRHDDTTEEEDNPEVN